MVKAADLIINLGDIITNASEHGPELCSVGMMALMMAAMGNR
jgi:hypothetical protein